MHMTRTVSFFVTSDMTVNVDLLQFATNLNFRIFQGSAATCLRCDGKNHIGFVGNLIIFPVVKE